MSGSHPSTGMIDVHRQWCIAIVRSVWHDECAQALTNDAVVRLIELGIAEENMLIIDAPGSLEIPLLTKTIIESGKADGVIVFGVIVQGQTHHAQMIATESARALMDIQLKSNTPIINEILFVDDIEHARSRSIGKDAKGALAADTLLTALAKLEDLR